MGDQREMGGFLGKRADLAMNMQLPAEETLTMEFTPLARQMLNAEKLRKRQCLLVLDGIDVGSLFIIEKNSIVLGRGQECDVVLRDDGISRQHAKISIIGPRRIVVEDLSSTNGTYVGGKRISRATLRIGEKILFGRRTMLRFVLDDALDLLEVCTDALGAEAIYQGSEDLGDRAVFYFYGDSFNTMKTALSLLMSAHPQFRNAYARRLT